MGLGAVYICHNCFSEHHIDNSKDMLIACSGEPGNDNFCSFGSRFGQAIAAVDIDGLGGEDGDELVVGAPLNSTTAGYDTGAIYVYKFTKKSGKMAPERLTLDLPKELTPGCQFGSAVENLGDIHNDGYEDFAVSAPYLKNENGIAMGAVFVYRGGRLDSFNGKGLIF